jgi:hypothetical protein
MPPSKTTKSEIFRKKGINISEFKFAAIYDDGEIWRRYVLVGSVFTGFGSGFAVDFGGFEC